MVSACEIYTEELRDRFGYLAAWLPNAPLEVGDIGELRRDKFERTSSLDNLSIPYATSAQGQPIDFEYTSSGSVTISGGADGKASAEGVAAEAQAGLTISFERENGVVFVARECTISTIEDRVSLGRQIEALYEQGKWDNEHCVITELVTVKSATILISDRSDARVDFRFGVGTDGGLLDLANVSANSMIQAASGIGVKIVGAEGLTPLFMAAGLKKRLFGGAKFKSRSSQGGRIKTKQDDAFKFGDVDYADLASGPDK